MALQPQQVAAALDSITERLEAQELPRLRTDIERDLEAARAEGLSKVKNNPEWGPYLRWADPLVAGFDLRADMLRVGEPFGLLRGVDVVRTSL